MPRAPSRTTQADLKRAIRAAEGCGKTVREILITREGARLIFADVDREETPPETGGPKPWPKS